MGYKRDQPWGWGLNAKGASLLISQPPQATQGLNGISGHTLSKTGSKKVRKPLATMMKKSVNFGVAVWWQQSHPALTIIVHCTIIIHFQLGGVSVWHKLIKKCTVLHIQADTSGWTFKSRFYLERKLEGRSRHLERSGLFISLAWTHARTHAERAVHTNPRSSSISPRPEYGTESGSIDMEGLDWSIRPVLLVSYFKYWNACCVGTPTQNIPSVTF